MKTYLWWGSQWRHGSDQAQLSEIFERSLQSAEWRASAYSLKQLEILRLSSQSITHCCQSAPPPQHPLLCAHQIEEEIIYS